MFHEKPSAALGAGARYLADMTADCIGPMTVVRQFYYDDTFMTPMSRGASAGAGAVGADSWAWTWGRGK
jgi:hypothetical protein